MPIVVSQPTESVSSVRLLGTFQQSEADFNQRIPRPDPRPGLHINLGAPMTAEMPDGTRVELPRAIFSRVRFDQSRLRSAGDCLYIGVDMFAWGTRFLIDEHIDLASTPIVPLDGLWTDFLPQLESTFVRYGETEALALLDQFIADLQRRRPIDVTPVRTAIEILGDSHGQFSLNDLAARCFLSPSQLERQFKYHVGVSPKMLARLIRLDATLTSLLEGPARPMTALAHRFGYVDQAHFIHEFKAFTGITPRQYLAAWH